MRGRNPSAAARLLRATLVAAFAVVALGIPAVAHAGALVFDSMTPAPGAVVSGTWTPTFAAALSSDVALSPYATVTVDAVPYVARVTNPVVGGVRDPKRGTISFARPILAPGSHAVTITVADTGGTTLSRAATFTLVPPAVLSAPLPADGSTVTTDAPEISALLDTRYTPQFAFTLDGVGVSWNYDPVTKRVRAARLPVSNMATHTASVRWFDGAGRISVLTWSFRTAYECFTTISQLAPAEGSRVGGLTSVSFAAGDPTGVPVRAEISVDGVPAIVGTSVVSPTGLRATSAPLLLGEGLHTVVARAWDARGGYAERIWSFTVLPPLRVTGSTPADGRWVGTTRPLVSVQVTSAAGGVTGYFSVGATSVAGTWNAAAGRLEATLPPQPDESLVSVYAHVTDASAASVTHGFNFRIRAYTTGPSAACVGCHTTYPLAHPMRTCDGCHHHGAYYGQVCSACHGGRTAHDVSMLYARACTECHTSEDPNVPWHPADVTAIHDETATPGAFDDCSACHVRSVSVEHALRTDAGGAPYGCATCHADTVRQQVRDAVAAMDTSCDGCHATVHVATGAFPGGSVFAGTRHATASASGVAAVSWPGTAYAPGSCANCHAPAGSPARPVGDGLCQGCHDASGTVKPAERSYQGAARYAASGHGVGAGSVPCAGCHSVHGTATASGTPIAHALSATDPRLCTGTAAQPGCHSIAANAAGGTNVRAAFESSTGASTHHDVMATSGTHIVCSSCHDPHSDSAAAPYSDPARIGAAVGNATDRFRDASGRVYALVGAQHDAAPPVLTTMAITPWTNPTNVSIAFASNEPANAWLQYGTTASYGSTTALSYGPATSFSTWMVFPVGVTYHMRANVIDQMGNQTLGPDRTYRVPWTLLAGAPVVSGGSLGTHVSATWYTTGACESWIDYGPTAAYGSSFGSAANVTTHTVTLPHLAPGVWHLRARSQRDGDLYTSADMTVTVYADSALPPVVDPVPSSDAIVGPTDVGFSWAAPDAVNGPFTYRLLLPSLGYASAWTGATSATLTLDAGTYTYTVEARDALGNLHPPAAIQSFYLAYPAASCPNLFTWNGERFDFVSDVMGLGPVGVKKSATTYMRAEPVEDTVIPPGSLRPRNGSLDIHLTDERAEIEFVDEVKMRAVDHPAGTRLLINDLHWGTSDGTRADTTYHTIAAPMPVSVSYRRTPILGTVTVPPTDISDACAVEGDGKLAYAGIYDDNEWTFDLGELGSPQAVKLVLTGWVDYADKREKAAWVAARKTVPAPRLEVADANGDWIDIGDAPHPPGYTKTVVYDLTGKFPAGVTRYKVRMRQYMRMNLDWAAVDTTPDRAVTVTELSAADAALAFKGRSAYAELPYPVYTFDQPGPSQLGSQTGSFTRYGDVRELLDAPDDRFVVMNTGDDLAISFAEPPAPQAGDTRTYVLHTDGYHQTVTGKVDPMPFHGMSTYPYPAGEHYPDDAEHTAYLAAYNTRVVTTASAAPAAAAAVSMAPLSAPDAVARLSAVTGVAHAGELPPPSPPATDDRFSVDTDRFVLQMVSDGSVWTTGVAAGWQSAGTTAAALTPSSPGASVGATTLAQAAGVNGLYWRTNLAVTDRAFNWQLVRFDVPAAALTGAKSMKLQWTGHGEPTTGYPTEMYLWDHQAAQWVRIQRFVSGTDVTVSHAEWQSSQEGFCISCHRAAPPAGAGGATAFADLAAAWGGDRHGDATGVGSGGGLAAPYARGQVSIRCDVCHDSHGSSNLYHLRGSINGTSEIVVGGGTQYANACRACHTGSVADWHAGECTSCHANADHASGRIIDESYDCARCHRHGYTWNHADMGCHGCADPYGLSWRTF